jgi:hypothetical protein
MNGQRALKDEGRLEHITCPRFGVLLCSLRIGPTRAMAGCFCRVLQGVIPTAEVIIKITALPKIIQRSIRIAAS